MGEVIDFKSKETLHKDKDIEVVYCAECEDCITWLVEVDGGSMYCANCQAEHHVPTKENPVVDDGQ